jgi:hypothetical protein
MQKISVDKAEKQFLQNGIMEAGTWCNMDTQLQLRWMYPEEASEIKI